jgi:hypothetical protein
MKKVLCLMVLFLGFSAMLLRGQSLSTVSPKKPPIAQLPILQGDYTRSNRIVKLYARSRLIEINYSANTVVDNGVSHTIKSVDGTISPPSVRIAYASTILRIYYDADGIYAGHIIQ